MPRSRVPKPKPKPKPRPKPKSGRRLVRLSLWPDPNDATWPGLDDKQRSNLLELLAPLLESANGDEVLSDIENAVADCKMWREAGVNAPDATRKKTTDKVSALRYAAKRLREAVLDLDDASIEVAGPAKMTPVSELASGSLRQSETR